MKWPFQTWTQGYILGVINGIMVGVIVGATIMFLSIL